MARAVRRCVLTMAAVLVLSALGAAVVPPRLALAAGEGQMTWAIHVSLAPTWFEPAETPALITPFMILYALHDALVKPMPGAPMAPSLAESWMASKDGMTYDFTLRKAARFHNGEPVTGEDVKFSFERYRGAAAKTFKEKVASVEVLDAGHVRFRMKKPWPDFMTFFGTPATGAAWIVPKKYVEKVGEDGFKKAPVGAGPYRFVSFNPGVELTMEAFDGYWRKAPSVKRLVFKSVPDESTRLAMLKRGEADIAYSIRGALAEEIKRTPGLALKATLGPFTEWVSFVDQWDPKSPWHDRRVRQAAIHAVDVAAINQAEYLGFARLTGNIIPSTFEFARPTPAYPFDPGKARQLLIDAGYPTGFDAGEISSDLVYGPVVEAVGNYLQSVGIRVKVKPLERAAFQKAVQDRKLKNLVRQGSAAFGNAATRIEAFIVTKGFSAFGGYADVDGLFDEQAIEIDRKKREATLVKIQQIVHDKAMFLPLFETAFLNGVGPRVAESGLGLITNHLYSAPFEDLKLRAK